MVNGLMWVVRDLKETLLEDWTKEIWARGVWMNLWVLVCKSWYPS